MMKKWLHKKIFLILFLLSLILGISVDMFYPGVPIGTVLFILSLVFISIFAVLTIKNMRDYLSMRSAKYGFNSILLIVILFGITVAINAIVHHHNVRFDTTSNKIYSLSDKTKEVLKLVHEPLTVYAFLSRNDHTIRKALDDLIAAYTHENGYIKLEVIDPIENPLKAKEFWISEKDNRRIIFKKDKLEVRVAMIDENSFTNALLKLYKKNDSTIYFSMGHDEGNYNDNSQLGYLLAAQSIQNLGYQVKSLDLNSSIPKDCSVLVVVSPRYKFSRQEFGMIQTYLGRGGNVVFLLDPTIINNFRDFLAHYGVYPQDKVIVDDINYINNKVLPVVTTYSGHDITNVFNTKNIKTFYPLASPIMGSSKPSLKSKYTPLVLSSSYTSWALSRYNLKNLDNNYVFDSQVGDLKGPLPVAGLIEMINDDGSTGKMIVWGDSEFINNTYFDFYGNGTLFINAVNWLVGDQDLVNISRTFDSGSKLLSLSSKDHNLLFYLFVVLVPGILLILGGAVWWHRRKQ